MANRTQSKSSEDSLLELRIRMERWVRKNRLWLIGAVAAIVIWLLAMGIYALVEQNRIQAANTALTTLQNDPTDAQALETLQSRSPQLYGLFKLQQAAQSGDRTALETLAQRNDLAGDMAAYQLALLDEDPQALGRYTQREGAPLREMAYLSEALIWHEQGEHQRARDALARVGFDSDMRDFAATLEHYGVVGE